MNLFESSALQIRCRDETLLLHPQRVLYWPAEKTLFAADVHVGKEHVFARSGIAIPAGISEDTLQRLFTLCDISGARRLIILGDFVHSTPLPGETWLATLSTLLDERPLLEVSIVIGNHDTAVAQSMTDDRVQWLCDSEMLGPFVLQHAPGDDDRGYLLSGHLHPAWRLSTSRRQSIRAPVFWFRERHAVLPAFGSFTGGMLITPDGAHDRLYMIGDEHVIPVPVSASHSGRKSRYIQCR